MTSLTEWRTVRSDMVARRAAGITFAVRNWGYLAGDLGVLPAHLSNGVPGRSGFGSDIWAEVGSDIWAEVGSDIWAEVGSDVQRCGYLRREAHVGLVKPVLG